jgi:hypothetical protein
MAQTPHGTDRELQAGIADLLKRIASDSAHVGVSVRGGMAMLFGEVGSTGERLQTVKTPAADRQCRQPR